MEIIECKEPFAHLIEAAPLMAAHWEEVTVAKDIQQLDPDMAQYEMIEKAGNLLVLLLKEGDSLAGYSVAILYRPLHWDLWACHVDIFYIDPAYRGKTAGLRLKKRTEELARSRGAKLMLWHGKPDTPFARLMDRTCDGVQDVTWFVRL